MSTIPPGLGPLNTPLLDQTMRGRGTQETDKTGKTDTTTGAGSATDSGPTPEAKGKDGKGVDQALPSTTTPPTDPTAAESRLQAVLDKLNDPDLPLDERMAAFASLINDPDILAELMIKFASMGREQALDARLAARDQARSQLMGQADETREAAQKAIQGAITNFAFAVAAAAISIGTAVSGLKSLTKVKGMNAQTLDLNFKANAPMQDVASKARYEGMAKASSNAADVALQSSQHQNAIYQSLTRIMDASGQAIQGGLAGSAKIDEAQGQELAALAQDTQANADVAKQQMEDMQEMMKTAMAFIKELNRLESELMANFTRLG